MISGDSDEDDVFVPSSKSFQINKNIPPSILENNRPLHLSPSSVDDARLSHYRTAYHHLPSSTSPLPLEQHHPMMRRLEMEARHVSVGGSVASTSSTSSSASPKSCILPPHPQLTPPLPHPTSSQSSIPTITSPPYLPPTPPSHYIPTSPFYHQYQQMLAAQRYQMLSQYAAAAAAANLPHHHSPFYASNASHFGFPHPPINSSFALSAASTTPTVSQLPFMSNSHLNISPSFDKIAGRSPSPPRPSKADSTTAIVSPPHEDSYIPAHRSPQKFIALPKSRSIGNIDVENTAKSFPKP